MQLAAPTDGARIIGSGRGKRGCVGSEGYLFLLCLDFCYASIDSYEVTLRSLANRVPVPATIITT